MLALSCTSTKPLTLIPKLVNNLVSCRESTQYLFIVASSRKFMSENGYSSIGVLKTRYINTSVGVAI